MVGLLAWAPAEKLFNEVDLSGWNVFPLPEKGAPSAWSVQDGTLICAGQPIGYIQTDRTYTNFELTFQWRFSASKGAGNSGVLLRKTGPNMVWPRSLEAQLHSENAGDVWNIGEFPARLDKDRTDGRRTTKFYPSNEKPIGEWNQYRIVVDGPTIMLFVNGTLQNVATDCEVVAGHIALQSEGAHIEFRQIEITELVKTTH